MIDLMELGLVCERGGKAAKEAKASQNNKQPKKEYDDSRKKKRGSKWKKAA